MQKNRRKDETTEADGTRLNIDFRCFITRLKVFWR